MTDSMATVAKGAMGRRSIFDPPAPEAAAAAGAEPRRRAGRPGGAEAGAVGRRHIAPASAKRPLGGIVPDTSHSYDAPEFVGAHPRRFFDHSVRASQYAELLERAESLSRDDGLPAAVLELEEGQPLPLALRRVLSAALPPTTSPDFPPEAAAKCGQEVEEAVRQCFVTRRPKPRAGPRLVVAPKHVDAVWPEDLPMPLPRPEGVSAGTAAQKVEHLPPVPEAGEWGASQGGLPTLLTSRPSREALLEKALVKTGATDDAKQAD